MEEAATAALLLPCWIAALLAERGATRVLTEVEVSNAPSRKAVLKAGSAEVAVTAYARTGPWSRTQVVPCGTGGPLAGQPAPGRRPPAA